MSIAEYVTPYPLVPLGEIARPVSRPISVEPGKSYRTLGVKWWGEGAYERQTIDGVETAAKTLSVVREGDLIINKIWVRHGSTAIAGADVDGCAASGEFPTFELDHSHVLPAWLHWQTKTAGFWAKCDALSQGTSGKNRIKPDLFLTIQVPLPPLAEQRRIVARIAEIAAKVAEARRLRVEAVEEANLFVSSLHHRLSEGRSKYLSEIITLHEEREDVLPGREYSQVGVKGFGQGLFAKAAVNASQTTYRSFNRLYWGAIVLSQVKGWEGAVAVCLDENLVGMYVSPEYRTFRCIDRESNAEYLAKLVATPWFWSQLSQASKGLGGRRERTRPEQFLQMMLPMPSWEQQQKAVTILRRIGPLYNLQAETFAELDALLPAVLDRAFRGEL